MTRSTTRTGRLRRSRRCPGGRRRPWRRRLPTGRGVRRSPEPRPAAPACPRRRRPRRVVYGESLGAIHEIKGPNNAEQVVWQRGYLYDTAGNRLLRTSLPGDDLDDPRNYSAPYDHDAHGNMTAIAQIPGGLTWDHDYRLQSTGHLGGGTVYYVYDGAGQRVRKVHVNQNGTTSAQRLYFGAWEIYRQHTNINTTPVLGLERETLHVHDDHGRVCLIETKTFANGSPIGSPANVARYQYTNHLGTANLELDDDAEVISYEEFHPYGTSSYRAANSTVEVSEKRYRYTGQERDEEPGLAYHGSRYYASWIARWTAADPIGIKGGVALFSYSDCNPVRLLGFCTQSNQPEHDNARLCVSEARRAEGERPHLGGGSEEMKALGTSKLCAIFGRSCVGLGDGSRLIITALTGLKSDYPTDGAFDFSEISRSKDLLTNGNPSRADLSPHAAVAGDGSDERHPERLRWPPGRGGGY